MQKAKMQRKVFESLFLIRHFDFSPLTFNFFNLWEVRHEIYY